MNSHQRRKIRRYLKRNPLRYEGAFVIVKDEWDKETAFPAAAVAQVESDPERRW